MANQNILDEYLVKLGFQADTVGYARFANALRDAASLVDNQYFSMAKRVAGFQAAAVGAFAAVGAGALGIVDKVAQADQEYRLLALHMFTSLPVARELKIALDALGQPLENVIWDPELAARFHQLVKDQQTLTQELGPNFEKQMVTIRDVRFEFTRLGVEMQYLAMMVVQDLATAFGTTIDGLLERMRKFNDWFISNMPRIAEWIATNLKPILMDVWEVMKATGQAVEVTAAAFVNLIGFLSGDTSLQGTATNFEKITKAIQITSHALAGFITDITHSEMILAHVISAMADLGSGNFSGAKAELKEAAALLNPKTGEIIGGVAGTLIGGPIGGAIGAGIGTGIGAQAATSEQQNYRAGIIAAAKQLGVPPELALAVAQVESGIRQTDKNGNVITSSTGARGIFQLLPSTARGLNENPDYATSNIVGGVRYLSQLLAKFHGDQAAALGAYSGQGSPLADPNYIAKVMAAEKQFSGDINVTVHVDKNGNATAKAEQGGKQREVQRNIGEFQVPGWSY